MEKNKTSACTKCGSEKIVKRGKIFNARQTLFKQRWFCKNCGTKFVVREPHICTENSAPKFEYKSKPETPTNWVTYNKAQLNEKPMFLEILNNVLDMFEFEQIKTGGRHVCDTKCMLFGMLIKIYNKNSARRTISDLKFLNSVGYLTEVPCYSTLMNYFGNTNFKPILEKIIELTAQPLKEVEVDFASDATGFSTSQFGRWFDEKWGVESERRIYRKAHVTTGVTTNIIASCIVTKNYGKGSADTANYKELLKNTAIIFKVREMSADMAYLSRSNLEATVQAGAIPYIPFKSNTTGGNNGLVWRKMWLYAKENPQEFFEHYHKRSNVESTFSMVKQKFGSFLMTKNFEANTNEILCKAIAHNICCLVAAYYELGIEKAFCTKAQETGKISVLL